MQLGEILDGGGEFRPVGREVEFHVLRQPLGGRQDKARVKAIFYFVDEPGRHEADAHAEKILQADPLYRDGGIPPRKREEEQFYCFLIRALRNSDNPAEPFCPLSDYQKFRRSLVSDVVSYLLREYKSYVAEEYPETGTAEQVADLAEQALGK